MKRIFQLCFYSTHFVVPIVLFLTASEHTVSDPPDDAPESSESDDNTFFEGFHERSVVQKKLMIKSAADVKLIGTNQKSCMY